MDLLKKYTLELSLTTLGIALIVVGMVFGTKVIAFNLDGFYLFLAGLLLTIYGVGTIFSKAKEQKKMNQNESKNEVD
ncbi:MULTISPECIES: hypothetical protein [Vagococcus]|uniref:hypothetical protein n=1 Tax=Vagococcus TaxID=2737 RepID=UPI002FCCAEAD